MIFFTSDSHFGHGNVIRHCNRPFVDAEDMDEFLVRAWNNVVTHKDTVYHLGDFAWGNPAPYIKSLRGKIMLVPGNHDKVSKFQEFVDKGKVVILPELYRCSLNGQYMTLSHYAMRVWDRHHHGAWNICGHSHGTVMEYGKQKDVGVDTTNEYRPYSFDEVQKIMNEKGRHKVDHHV